MYVERTTVTTNNESKFFASLSKVIKDQNNVSITEKGGMGYATTYRKVTDMFYKLSSYRNSPYKVESDFAEVINEDLKDAILFMFYVGDIREGAGERKTFLTMLDMIAKNFPGIYLEIFKFIPEYARFDYLWRVKSVRENKELFDEVIDFIRLQLAADLDGLTEGKEISLLAKWLPSENATSAETKEMATLIRTSLKMSSKTYRKMLSALRAKINIVETDLCEKTYTEINYEHIPSKANKKYKKAFLRNDRERYQSHINAVNNGTAKMHSSVLNPCELASEYLKVIGWTAYLDKLVDPSVEAMWKNLRRDKVVKRNILPIIDGSGSMYDNKIKDTSLCCEHVAASLGIYMSEINTGFLKNKVMAFGTNNYIVDLSECKTFHEKLAEVIKFTDCGTTDIKKVFTNILSAGTKAHLTQEEMPEILVIYSDMEFDRAIKNASKKDFEFFAELYRRAGYKLPKIVF